MSYVFFPPRVDNYYPPGPPYLAGLRGLGDYAADLAAYKVDYDKWRIERLQYTNAVKTRDTLIKKIDDTYNAALAAYVADKAAWDKEYAAYLVAAKSWNANFEAKKKANTERAMVIAQAHGLNLSQAFYSQGACLSQAEHDAAARNCTTVKGLGRAFGLSGSDVDCGLKKLPVCDFGPYPTVRAQPKAPSKPAYPAVPMLRAEPVAPVAPPPAVVTKTTKTLTQTPSSVPVTVPTQPVPNEALTPEESKHSNVLMNGLIVVAVLGGGYLVWRTLKKPKAQAA